MKEHLSLEDSASVDEGYTEEQLDELGHRLRLATRILDKTLQ